MRGERVGDDATQPVPAVHDVPAAQGTLPGVLPTGAQQTATSQQPAFLGGSNSRGAPGETARRPAVTWRRRGPLRRARLSAVRIDPWSVMKIAFLLSIALGITICVAVAVIWKVLDASGVFDSISRTVNDVVGTAQTTPFNLRDYVSLRTVMGFTVLISVVDVVLLTALSTLGAFVYNFAASLLGGFEVTLAEDD